MPDITHIKVGSLVEADEAYQAVVVEIGMIPVDVVAQQFRGQPGFRVRWAEVDEHTGEYTGAIEELATDGNRGWIPQSRCKLV